MLFVAVLGGVTKCLSLLEEYLLCTWCNYSVYFFFPKCPVLGGELYGSPVVF